MVLKNETLALFIFAYNYKIFNFMDLAKAIQDILLPQAKKQMVPWFPSPLLVKKERLQGQSSDIIAVLCSYFPSASSFPRNKNTIDIYEGIKYLQLLHDFYFTAPRSHTYWRN